MRTRTRDPAGRPNILLIMDDQHRHDFLGCAGASFLRTPHLDALAARGVRFTQCTVNAPVCAPSRIALASGLQPARMGSLDNQSFLPRRVPTYYQHFRDHGYRVGCVGKVDLAKPDPYNGRYGDRPCLFSWGFTHPEECEGKMHAASSPTPLGPYTYYLQERGLFHVFRADYQSRARNGWIRNSLHDSVLPADAYEDAYVGRRAVEWLQSVPDDFPWHFFVSFVGPHDPFDPPTEYATTYRNAEMPPAIPAAAEGKPKWIARRVLGLTPEEVAVSRRQYCAEIELVDDYVGRIVRTLEERGMSENTVVVFTSDHGEMLGDHGLYTKSVAYESALRVPLLVAGPGIAGGRVSHALVELMDLNPTISELAGLPPQEALDARSFAPVLRQQGAEHRLEAVTMLRNFRAVRTATHKLIENVGDVAELYCLTDDPHELHNVADAQPELVRELRGRLAQRFLEGKWWR
jgi:choline-sulfatase